MNKKVLVGLITVVVVSAGIAMFLIFNNANQVSQKSGSLGNDKAKTLAAVKACDLLTLAEAKQLMGESTTTGSNTAPATSGDIAVDNCSYTNNATSVPAIRTVTLMVRSPLTEEGIESNKVAFEPGGAAHSTGAVVVEGYGDKATWDPTTRQLAILKDTVWISVTYGGTNPMNNTLEDTKKAADLAVN